jgi:hypothetical protein
MKAGIPSWEAELWSLISSGDGEQCPLYEQCRQEPERGYCISEHREHLERLLDTSNFDPANYAFLDGVKPNRLFELVDRLAQKYIEMGNITSPPVPERLVTLCDPKQPIEVRELPLKLYQGALWHLKDRWVIHLNSATTFGRKRFTLFHEAFHILAHGNSTPVFRRRGSEKGAFNELLAECFASCVLMPTDWVRERWAEVRDIDRMAEIFDVPFAAMWLRLKLLELI